MLELNFTPFPVLKTERLLMRRISHSDENEMFFLRSDEYTLRYINRPPAKTMEEVTKFISLLHDIEATNEGITWAITFHDSDILLGTICFWNIQKVNYRAEIGYVLHPQQHGKGIMNEAMNAMLTYGFNRLQFHSFEAKVNPENAASIKLLERNKFVREAYFREDYFYDGMFLDTAVYSLLSSTYKSK